MAEKKLWVTLLAALVYLFFTSANSVILKVLQETVITLEGPSGEVSRTWDHEILVVNVMVLAEASLLFYFGVEHYCLKSKEEREWEFVPIMDTDPENPPIDNNDVEMTNFAEKSGNSQSRSNSRGRADKSGNQSRSNPTPSTPSARMIQHAAAVTSKSHKQSQREPMLRKSADRTSVVGEIFKVPAAGQGSVRMRKVPRRSPLEILPLIPFGLSGAIDWISTLLQNLGILYSFPSAYQVLKTSRLIFVTIITSIFVACSIKEPVVLAKSVRLKQWMGLVATFVGVMLVSIGAILIKGGSFSSMEIPYETLLGLGLITAGVALSALRLALQESFLKKAPHIPTSLAVGVEGLCGLVIGALVVAGSGCIPGIESVSVPRFIEDIQHSPRARWVTLCVGIISVGHNFFGAVVGVHTSSAGRAILACFATVLIFNTENFFANKVPSFEYKYDLNEAHFYFLVIGYFFSVIGVVLYFNMVTCHKEKEINAADEQRSLQRSRATEMRRAKQAQNADDPVPPEFSKQEVALS